jgi:hypothetical protein
MHFHRVRTTLKLQSEVIFDTRDNLALSVQHTVERDGFDAVGRRANPVQRELHMRISISAMTGQKITTYLCCFLNTFTVDVHFLSATSKLSAAEAHHHTQDQERKQSETHVC